ncbi:MAG: hypothetical protein AB8B60_03535 [Sulfitobacter sp.]
MAKESIYNGGSRRGIVIALLVLAVFVLGIAMLGNGSAPSDLTPGTTATE